VAGHPLFDALTEDKIEAEINQWAFTHFKSILTGDNKHAFKAILDEIINDLDETRVDKLACFDIPQEKQEEFMEDLTQKYGTQFSDNGAFVSRVRNELLLIPEADNSRFRYHVLKLLGSTNFYPFLESSCLPRASNAGFFSQNKTQVLKPENDANEHSQDVTLK
jgi:hypothetical protein